MIEGKLSLREEVRPAVGGERNVARRQDGDKVVLGGTNGSFRREGAMTRERDVLVHDVGRVEEGDEVRGSLVVEREVSERVREGLEKGDDIAIGRDVRGGRAGF